MLGHANTTELEREFGQFAQKLLTSVRIAFTTSNKGSPVNPANPINANDDLTLRFSLPLDSEVKVTAVRALVKWRIDSVKPGSILEVTEVEQLEVARVSNGGSGSRTMEARAWSTTTKAVKKYLGEYPYWYEASVISADMEAAFVENSLLCVGQKAEWEVDVLAGRGAFTCLYAPAIDMALRLRVLGKFVNNGQQNKK